MNILENINDIPNENFIASSELDSQHKASNARPMVSNGSAWKPTTENEKNKNLWLQIDMGKRRHIVSVSTHCNKNKKKCLWVQININYSFKKKGLYLYHAIIHFEQFEQS